MRVILLIGLCLLTASGSGLSLAGQEDASLDGDMLRRFVILRQVMIGMSRTEVRAVLALPVIVGYVLPDRDGRYYRPLTEENPRRSETLKRGRTEYAVDYYLVGIQNQDGKITDDEMAPLVFRNDKLIGMGWDFLNDLQ